MRMGVPISLGMEGWADALSFIVFSGMWLVMMLAMMLPSTYPTLLLHRTIFEKRRPETCGGRFCLGWATF
ncbi:MAG: DUF2182 domain-containing protein [Acidobacteria bacterium]|nr:DUF2182 domain-containing protein [Acidobacteriota bacterium]